MFNKIIVKEKCLMNGTNNKVSHPHESSLSISLDLDHFIPIFHNRGFTL